MVWKNPLALTLVPTTDSESFKTFKIFETGVPHGDKHPGAFGYQRKNHIHEGVDLYCKPLTPVYTVEAGKIIHVLPFTGPSATPPSPWWYDTWSTMVQGESGCVLYGEIDPFKEFYKAGMYVDAGVLIGHVLPVLTKDKGRPTTMLHLELHTSDATEAFEWIDVRPKTLLDPTPYLLEICK